MLNIVDLTFNFEFGKINNRSMTVEIESNNQTVLVTNNIAVVNRLVLPNCIKIKFSGKVNGKDTKIDSQGNILEDMYVKLTGIKIDNLKIPDWAIQKNLWYVTTDGNVIKTAYIGFNGIMTIDIPESTVFSFYRRLTRDNQSTSTRVA